VVPRSIHVDSRKQSRQKGRREEEEKEEGGAAAATAEGTTRSVAFERYFIGRFQKK